MKKIDDLYDIYDNYDYVEADSISIIGETKEEFVHRVDIEYAASDKSMDRILFAEEFDFINFKQWLLSKDEEIYCINYNDESEEYIFKKHIMRVDIIKGELIDCRGMIYFITPK